MNKNYEVCFPRHSTVYVSAKNEKQAMASAAMKLGFFGLRNCCLQLLCIESDIEVNEVDEDLE